MSHMIHFTYNQAIFSTPTGIAKHVKCACFVLCVWFFSSDKQVDGGAFEQQQQETASSCVLTQAWPHYGQEGWGAGIGTHRKTGQRARGYSNRAEIVKQPKGILVQERQ